MRLRDIVVVLALALSACDGATAASDAGYDGEGRLEQTRTYVIGSLSTSEGLPSGQAFGIDLDGMNGGDPSLPCTGATDFASAVTGATGIDDQLGRQWATIASMAGPDGVDGMLHDESTSGEFLVALTVTDLTSFDNDDTIRVLVRLVRGPAGTAPAPSPTCAALTSAATCATATASACRWSASRSACTGIAADQALEIVMELGTLTGGITRGRLVASGDVTLPLRIVASGLVEMLPLNGLHLDVPRITPDALLDGQLGGTLLIDSLVELASMFGGLDRATIESLVMPDLLPDATGAHCAGISTGLGFTALAAAVM